MKMREYEVLVLYNGGIDEEWISQDAFSKDDAKARVFGWMGYGDYIIKEARLKKRNRA